jgi:diamine N-acetyltransferase
MLIIKPITLNNAEILSALSTQIYAEHYTHLWDDEGIWYANNSFSISQLQEELSDFNNLFFFASHENQNVGFLKLRPQNQLADEEGDGFEIERIYLQKSTTGKGIGRQLVAFAIGMAVAQNKDYVWLKAIESSFDAVNFYKKLGFEVCGTSRLDYPLLKPELRGMVTMKKVLK